jgi:hypothetical protein
MCRCLITQSEESGNEMRTQTIVSFMIWINVGWDVPKCRLLQVLTAKKKELKIG